MLPVTLQCSRRDSTTARGTRGRRRTTCCRSRSRCRPSRRSCPGRSGSHAPSSTTVSFLFRRYSVTTKLVLKRLPYPASRSRHAGHFRTRSATDDELIHKVVDFSLSHYTRSELPSYLRSSRELTTLLSVRKHGQTVLDSVSKVSPRARPIWMLRLLTLSLSSRRQVYDGTKTLIYPRLLASLLKGVDPDQTKGALYVIGGKSVGQ